MTEEHITPEEWEEMMGTVLEEMVRLGNVEEVDVDGEPRYRLTVQGQARKRLGVPLALPLELVGPPPLGKREN